MSDGSTRTIETLREGDRVWSRNEKSGKTEIMTVSRTTHRTSGVVVHLALANQAGKVVERFVVSTEHPFYVEGKGWVGAGELGIGTQIVTRAGPCLVVQSVEEVREPRGCELYNLTVEGDHTYFVGTEAGGAWVHNVDACNLFPNRVPGDLADELAMADRLGVSPAGVGDPAFDEMIDGETVKWAVTAGGELRFIPHSVHGEEIAHSVLTAVEPVQAAGQALIAGGKGQYYLIEITNHSGHFEPSLESLEIGRNAFHGAGIR